MRQLRIPASAVRPGRFRGIGSFVAILLLTFACTASAQYMYLDANGDGINTAADNMNDSGATRLASTWTPCATGTVLPSLATPTLGRLLRELLSESFAAAGEHAIRIDGRGRDGVPLASGVYFYRIESRSGAPTGRFAILR